MKEITFEELNENMIKRIGKDWMLITSGTKSDFNMMTASWGGVGYFWQKPIAIAVIRPTRYTKEFVERSNRFTLSFYPESEKKKLSILGTKSGRNMDKMHDSGLTPMELPDGEMSFEEAWLTLDCEVCYKNDLIEENFLDHSILEKWYTPDQGGLHRAYFA